MGLLWWSSVLTIVGAAQRFSFEFDAMGIVNEAIQYSVGVGGVADQRMPTGHGKLAGDQGGFSAVAVFEYFEQMMAGDLETVKVGRATLIHYRSLKGLTQTER